MTTSIHERAMIVTLSTSSWAASRTDKNLSKELTDKYHAKADRARVRKQLIDKDAIKDLHGAIIAAKQIHNRSTLPWDDHGGRILPVEQIEKYRESMAVAENAIAEKRRAFCESYVELVAQAREDLGDMFDHMDYPPPQDISRKFGMRFDIDPIPNSAHFIVDLNAEDAAKIKEEIDKRTTAKVEHAMVTLAERIESSLRALIEKLGFDADGNPRRVHASAIDALDAIADSVAVLNLTNDKRLARLAARIKKAIMGLDADEVRYRSRKPAEITAVTKRREELSKNLESIATAYFGKPTKT